MINDRLNHAINVSLSNVSWLPSLLLLESRLKILE
jgi:hypothetical protein